jgi:hypothetical protein
MVSGEGIFIDMRPVDVIKFKNQDSSSDPKNSTSSNVITLSKTPPYSIRREISAFLADTVEYPTLYIQYYF